MYFKHFGLKGDPFSLTPSTALYCKIQQHDEALKTIMFALHQRDGLFLVTAEIGLGKTFLARKLLNSLNSDKYHTCYIYNTCISPSALAIMIASELGIKKLNGKYFYQTIHDRLIELNQQGKRVVIILDEVQAMPTKGLEFIRLLTNLETENFKLIQVVMFSQPELLRRLRQYRLRQLTQRIVYHCQLNELSYHECNHYLEHRIASLGGNPLLIIPKKTVKMVWKITGGNLRAINILAKRAMLAAYSRGSLLIKADDINKAKKEISLSLSSSTKKKPTDNRRHRIQSALLLLMITITTLILIKSQGLV